MINKKYFHIDNGGFGFEVDEHGGLSIDFGFFGYSTTKIYLTPNKDFNIKELGDFLNESVFLLEQDKSAKI